jgi:hypothetical protein
VNSYLRILVCILSVAAASCSGSGGPAAPSPPPATGPQIPSGVSGLVGSMYQQLPDQIAAALAENQANLPRNPQNAVQINEKIALLQRPTLAAEMSNSRRFVEGSASSISGGTIAFAALFPEDWMRAEAEASIRTLERALPVLERFVDTPFPGTSVRVWYGFKIGNSGGGGQLFTEDRTTYESRTLPTRLPYDAILGHELAHSYVSNESLTQFLEMYAFNRILTGSTDVRMWTFTRDYVPFSGQNRDSAALLDVYQLLGHDPMARAYTAVLPLRPPYGEPLSAAARQVFVDQAPDSMKTAVAEKVARITF